MRLWIFSDIHIESCRWGLPEPRPEHDVIIAAGDIHNPASMAVRWLAEHSKGKPVIFVPGNHEWYASREPFTVEAERSRAAALASELGIHMLMDQTVIIDGVRFLGASLWTDYALYETPERSMLIAAQMMNDHRLIYPDVGNGPLRPKQARDWHVASRTWLAAEVARPSLGQWDRTVVVTHHMPHLKSIAAQYFGDPLNPAFCSDLSDLVEGGGAALWVHGHTHTSCDHVAGCTRVVCNPKGYGPSRSGGRIENIDFDPWFVVEV